MKSLRQIFQQRKGNFGHKGRPGLVGGSAPSGSSGLLHSKPKQMIGETYPGTLVVVSKDGDILGTNFKDRRQANDYMKNAPGNQEYDVMSVEEAVSKGLMKQVESPVGEGFSHKDSYDPDFLEKEYKAYKKMSMADLKDEYRLYHKITDIDNEQVPKWAIISDIMRAKYGDKRMQAWVAKYP